MTQTSPQPVRAIAAGIAAGLVASLAMDLFQKAWGRVVDMPQGGDPATVKAAQKASRAATGKPLAGADKDRAGQVVHYAFGASLGAAYALAAAYRPGITRGFGTAFGLATATAFDEMAVPAVGLSKSPETFPPRSHVYGYLSHLVFGSVTEAVRRALRTR